MLKRPYTYASHVSKFEIEMPIHIVNSCLRLKSSKSVCVDDQSPERIESDQVTLFNIISLLSAYVLSWWYAVWSIPLPMPSISFAFTGEHTPLTQLWLK